CPGRAASARGPRGGALRARRCISRRAVRGQGRTRSRAAAGAGAAACGRPPSSGLNARTRSAFPDPPCARASDPEHQSGVPRRRALGRPHGRALAEDRALGWRAPGSAGGCRTPRTPAAFGTEFPLGFGRGSRCGHGDARYRNADRHPLKAQSQVPFHRRHELSRVLAEVQSFAGFGRDDELPEARVFGPLPPAEAIRDVDLLLVGVEAKAWPSLLLGSFACQIAPMDAPARPAAVLRVADLDDALLQHGGREAEEGHARGRETPYPAPSATASGNRAQAARAGSPALARNPPGTKPHLGALTFGVLHRTHSPEPHSGDRPRTSSSAPTSLDGSAAGRRPSARRSPSSLAGSRSRRSGTSR